MVQKVCLDMFSSCLSPEELAFIAEDSLTYIVPTVPLAPLALLCGSVGPLVPQVPAQVPLWLALHLVKRNQCRLRAPEWLSKSSLEKLLSDERADSDSFGVLPCESFVETASLFLEHGREQLADAERVRQLVEAIVECRKGKVLAGREREKQNTTKILTFCF